MNSSNNINITPAERPISNEVNIDFSPALDSTQAILPQQDMIGERQSTSAVKQQTPVPAQPLKGPESAPDPIDIEAVLEQISAHIKIVERNIEFTVSSNSGRTIISVIDKETNEIIRQIPPEEVVQLASRLQEQNTSGLLEAFV